jgi:integrase
MDMRRRRGDGSVSKRKDGRYEAAAYIDTPTGNKRVRRYAPTRIEAEELLVEMRNNNRNGVLTNSREQKLSNYMDYWLSVVRSSIRQSTFTSYESTVRIYLKPGLGHKFLTKLNVSDVQSFLNNQLKLGKSVRNIHKMRVVLSAILQFAEHEDKIFRNAARGTKVPMYKPKEVIPWNFKQLGIFLEEAQNNRYYPIFILMTLYGLRTGEIIGLSWSDIDLENNLIRIKHQVKYSDGQYIYSDVKTQAGRRDLPLMEKIITTLSNIPKNNSGPLPDLIFKTSGNLPIDNGKLRKSFKQIGRDANLPIITLHHLRHTVATNLKNLGTSAKDAQSILGHAHISTTLQIYQHSDFEDKTKVIAQYEQKLVDLSASSRQLQPSTEKAIA